MNNTLCLGLFLLVMHIRALPWTYSSEVITTVGAPSHSSPTQVASLRSSQGFVQELSGCWKLPSHVCLRAVLFILIAQLVTAAS